MRKEILYGILFGVGGILLSSIILYAIVSKLENIWGWFTIISGMISGGAFGLGYGAGKGKVNEQNKNTFMYLCIFFGFFGVIMFYLIPFILYNLNFNDYLEFMNIGFLDIIFILLGAYGGELAGKWTSKLLI